MKLPWQNTHAPAVAFAVLALAGGIGLKAAANQTTERLYETQLAGCHRNNVIRVESNRRIASHEAETDVLRNFLSAAKSARIASNERSPNAGDEQAIDQYTHLIAVLDAKVEFRSVPLIDCKKAIKKP